MIRALEIVAASALLVAFWISLWLLTAADTPMEWWVALSCAGGTVCAAVWWWDR